MEELPSLPTPERAAHVRRVSAVTAGLIPLLYLGLFRLAFDTEIFRGAGGVVSVSFMTSVPLAFGALCVAVGRWRGSDDWLRYGFLGPTILLGVGMLLSVVFRLEAMVCILMGAPILYVCSVLGAGIAHQLLPRNKPDPRLHLSLAVLLPFAAAAVESSLHWPTETKLIEDTIVIQAPAERIWPEIASVRAIARAELSNRWIYWVGFPRPIAATLDHAGVGGVRTATFERDVSFLETVTTWDQPRRLAFTIHADPGFIPHTAFDQHIIVGGRFYDVLDGLYEIEPLTPTSCRLHLTSHHRLGTRFNAYAGWWSERIMNQIQGSILEVIRRRAEADVDEASRRRVGAGVTSGRDRTNANG